MWALPESGRDRWVGTIQATRKWTPSQKYDCGHYQKAESVLVATHLGHPQNVGTIGPSQPRQFLLDLLRNCVTFGRCRHHQITSARPMFAGPPAQICQFHVYGTAVMIAFCVLKFACEPWTLVALLCMLAVGRILKPLRFFSSAIRCVNARKRLERWSHFGDLKCQNSA